LLTSGKLVSLACPFFGGLTSFFLNIGL
jgi:hypothetical protein